MGNTFNTGRLINGLFVDASGNVGIGTTTPAEKLSVIGNIRIDNGAADGGQLVLASSGFSDWNLDNFSGNFRAYYGATERMRLTASGELLINATSNGAPNLGYQLGVRGTNANTQISIALANQTLSTQGCYIGLDASIGYMQMIDNKPWTFATNNTERMRISANGNVLINKSTAAGYRFEVNGDIFFDKSDGTYIALGHNGSIKGYLGIGSQVSSGGTTNDIGLQSNNNLSFATGTSFTERMRITSAGRVGIGTTNPQYLFAVSGGRAHLPYICSNQFIAGQISGNLNAVVSPNFILMFNMTDDPAGWSCSGTINAAAWDCWNISTIWVRKLNGGTTVNAGITGLYKSGCDFAICDITYVGKRWIAFRFTSNPEINVMLTGYGLNTQFNSDGSAQVVSSGVSVNSILASY